MAISIVAAVAEFIAMWLFVIIGCGTAAAVGGSTTGGYLCIALAFGFAITALAYSIGHLSGGHINCAVTFGLVLAGACPPIQGIINVVAQIFGSFAGAATLLAIFPKKLDRTGNIGANLVNPDAEVINALVAEVVGTFLLMFVVLQTAVNKKSEANRAQACIAIGFSVFLAHCVLIRIDGCSINPTRTIGPNILGKIRQESDGGTTMELDDIWVFMLGPLLGAALAVGVYKLMCMLDPEARDLPEGTKTEGSI
jgi:MIP family channel proteins